MAGEIDRHKLSAWAQSAIGAARNRPLLASVVVTAFVSVIFMLVPGIDAGFSRLFYRTDGGFTAGSAPDLKLLRSLGLLSINISIGSVALVTIWRCLIPSRVIPRLIEQIRPSTMLFLTSTLVIGPGLIANLILKDHWGRARPIASSLFGGSEPFTLPWVISNACTRNCSFVSGEASGAFWFIAFAFVVPESQRGVATYFALVWAAALSLNRIAFGGHFLSDVLIGWGLMLIILIATHKLVIQQWGTSIDARIVHWTGADALPDA